MQLLAASHRGLTVAEVATATKQARATVTAVLNELAHAEWAVRESDLRYRVGPAFRELCSASAPLDAAVGAVLAALARRTGCGVTLSRIEPRRLTVVAKQHGATRIVPGLAVGQRVPLSFPAGAAVMPWRVRADRDAWLATAPGRRQAGVELLRSIRQRGYAVFRPSSDDAGLVDVLSDLLGVVGTEVLQPELRDRVLRQLASLTSRPYTADELDGEAALPVSYLTAPVFDDAVPRYELQLAPLSAAVSGAQRREFVTALREAARELSEMRIGG